MKRVILLVATLAVSAPALAVDVDLVPHGFVSKVIRETQHGTSAAIGLSRGETLLTAPASGPRVSHARAAVTAETREAARLGLLHFGEEGSVQATPAQEAQIQAAGQRVFGVNAASR